MTEEVTPPRQFADAVDRAHEEAGARFGAHDFGPSDYLLGLEVLLLSMDCDPHFSPGGRGLAWERVIEALAARAFVQRQLKERQVPRGTVVAPVVITGVPRTGTTALHKLLAVDPQFQGIDGWLASTPMPRPPRDDWADNPYYQSAVAKSAKSASVNPGMARAHPTSADELDECQMILRQGFVSNIWPCQFPAATYDAWWQTQDELSSYQWLATCLDLIGSADPDRRWLLKNPGHILDIECLFGVFGDAKVVVTHRDPAVAIPSLCAALMSNYRTMEEGSLTLRARWLGIRETETWANAVRRLDESRAKHEGQIFDVRLADFSRDPMSVVDRIYEFAGAELQSDVRIAMEARAAAAPELARGTHSYDIADYGRSASAIRERFGDYVGRFDLVGERER